MSVAAAVAVALAGAACDPGPGDRAQTGPTPPDRLTVTAEGGGIDAFRTVLECAVVDRDACVRVIGAIESKDAAARCVAADGGDRRLLIDGTIGGEAVHAVLERRTDCEIAAYDAAARAVGF